MPGRYAAFRALEDVSRIFNTLNAVPDGMPTWNLAPTRAAPVVRRNPETGARHLDLLRWGFVPRGTTDLKPARRPMINARSETAATLSMFREALARRRCLVPIDAFYEWQETRGAKIPYAIARADGAPIAAAGLWEGWRGDDGHVLRAFTILTTDANDQLRRMHDRMPVIVEPADWPIWLGEADGDFSALMRPSRETFRVWQVSTAVNNVRNDRPDLLDPVSAD